jgi:hypothetical protein
MGVLARFFTKKNTGQNALQLEFKLVTIILKLVVCILLHVLGQVTA